MYQHETEDVLHISFNPEFGSLIVCSSSGLRVFDLNAGESPVLRYHTIQHGAILLGERILNFGAIAIVRALEPRRLMIHNLTDSKTSDVGAHRSEVLAVKVSDAKIVVFIEDEVIIYNAKNLTPMYVLQHAIMNSLYRACALTFKMPGCGEESTILAYPTDRRKGEVALLDIESFRQLPSISAHDSEIVALTFNTEGNLIASASEKGTVIRIFTVPGRKLVHELQRGLMRSVAIQSLAFRHDSRLLACSSDKETVHIFSLVADAAERNSDDNSILNYISKSIVFSGVNLLPSTMSKVLVRKRSFATVTLPTPGGKTIAAWSKYHNSLLVISEQATLRMFDAAPRRCGEWPVQSTFSLLDPPID